MSLSRRGLQPLGRVRLWRGAERATKPFLARTVLVKDNDVDQAIGVVNKNMGREGLMTLIRRTQRFEKPYLQRQRINYETCKGIYDEDMERKIRFISRKNRLDPYPGQY